MRRRGYSYIRFSSLKQAQGNSLARQLTATKDYCDKNNLDLDESLSLRDLGVSGYKGNNLRNGSLGAFVDAVRQGRIARGSVMVIESVDRLGRDQVSEALTLFLDILRHGVEIATLTPERLYTAESVNDIGGLLECIIYMSRAWEESATKSVRVKSAWNQKRLDVRNGKRHAIGKREPFWIRSVDGKFELIPEQVEILQQMFDWMIAGHGYSQVARKLNDMGLKTPRLGKQWQQSTVVSIVKSRACLGEYHPSVMIDGVQVEEGDPILDYYPRVISDDTWYRAHHAATLRKRTHGRTSSATKNLFTGLLYNGKDGQLLYYFHSQVKTKTGMWISHKLASKSKVMCVGESDKTVLYYDPFESAFLKYLIEVNPRDFVKGGTDSTNRVAELTGRLVDIDHKMATVNKKMKEMGTKNIEPLLNLMLEFTEEKESLRDELERLRSQESNHRTDTLGASQSLAAMLANASEEEAVELRVKLRQVLKGLIKKITVYTEDNGRAVRNKPLYTLLVWIRFHEGFSRWFSTNQDGALLYNVKMQGSLKKAYEEATKTP